MFTHAHVDATTIKSQQQWKVIYINHMPWICNNTSKVLKYKFRSEQCWTLNMCNNISSVNLIWFNIPPTVFAPIFNLLISYELHINQTFFTWIFLSCQKKNSREKNKKCSNWIMVVCVYVSRFLKSFVGFYCDQVWTVFECFFDLHCK